MNCRVSADLREYERLTDIGDREQAVIDADAERIFHAITGESRDVGDYFGQWIDSLDDVALRELFSEYLARLWADRDRQVKDDRHIIAREYLESLVKPWCEAKAEEENA